MNNHTSGPDNTDHASQLHHKFLKETAKTAFFRLLDQVSPQGLAIDASTRHICRMCGCWLARRRLELQISNTQAAIATGVDIQALLLLETGLADEHLIPPATQDALGRLLASPPYDGEWVSLVIAVAVRRASLAPAPLIEHIMIDLSKPVVPSLRADQAAENDSADSAPLDAENLLYEPLEPKEKYQVLLSLAGRESDSYGIIQEIKHRTGLGIGVMSIEGLLEQMLAEGLIIVAHERPDPDFDDEPEPFYALTGLGRQVAEQETLRQKRQIEDNIRIVYGHLPRLARHGFG